MRFKFGSFNLMNFGKTALTKRNFSRIADIINREGFDVVAFQEILSNGSSLEYLTKNYLPGWDIRWKEPKESSDYSKQRDRRGEGYAFIWNSRRLSLASSVTDNGDRIYEPDIIDRALNYDVSLFSRIPFYARFVPVNGGFFEFRLINVHLHFGDNTRGEIARRQEEYLFLLNRVYPTISKNRKYGNNRYAYTIVMGDYNLNLYKPRGAAENSIIPSTYIPNQIEIDGQVITTVQDELTTLKRSEEYEISSTDNPTRGYSQNYDHFSFDSGVIDGDTVRFNARRIDAVRKYCNDDFELYHSEISDHVPISLELIINE